MLKAGIDLGTHTGRLIIAEVKGRRIERVLYKKAQIIALGEGTALTGLISLEALKRAAALLNEYCQTMAAYGVNSCRAVTTNAMRVATNQAAALDYLQETTGVELEVISGETEAYLGYTGIASAFPEQDFLSFDIGGGSTEFALCQGGALKASFSLKVGSVSLTERFCHSDPVTEAEYQLLSAAAMTIIQPALAPLPLTPATLLIGVAGTVTNLAAIKQQMTVYDPALIHKSLLSQNDIDGMIIAFRRQTVAERKKIVGLEPQRARVILAGAVLVNAIMATTGIASLTVSEADLLEGIVLVD